LEVPIPSAIRRARDAPVVLRPALRVVATGAFLLESSPAPGEWKLRRLWAEVVWSMAMRCLRWNVTRAVRVRLTRARWRVLRRRSGPIV